MTTGMTRPPFTDLPSPGEDRPRDRRWWRVAVAVLTAVAVAVWAVVLVRGGGDDVVGTSPSPASSAPPTTPPTAPPTAGPTTPPSAVPTAPAPGAVVDRSTAVWPVAGSGTAPTGPVAAATGFATEFLGFEDPVVGPFQQGDSRSGEVEVRPTARGPVTTVLVRQLSGEQTWSVLGATTAEIEVTAPTAGAVVSSPLAVRGSAWTFEGNVTVQVRQDGRQTPLGEDFVTGGGDAMRPFSGTVTFARPTARYGSLVLLSHSAQDGAVWQAAVLRVQLRPDATTPAAAQMTVTVWFTRYDGRPDGTLVPVQRVVPRTSGVLRAALTALLAGPTDTERGPQGLTSWFSPDTAGMLRDVTVTDGKAVVDFADLRRVIPDASSSAGSQMLLDQLNATVSQFPTVRTVEYRIEGESATFAEWLQLDGPGASG